MSETDQISPSRLKNWFDRCLDIAAQLREARATLAEMKKEDKRKQVDWGRLRALAVARDADLHDEKKHDRVKTMLGKGTYASWYADIVGIGNSEQIVNRRSSTLTKGQSAEHNARSAPVAAVGGEGSGDRGPTAATNSESAEHPAPKPAVPSKTPSGPAAEMAPSVSAATISDGDIRGTMFDRSLWV